MRLRAVPEIILGGGVFFFQTPPPPGHTRSQSPPTPRTRKCFKLARPTMDQIRLDPQDKLPPHPPPLGHIINKTPSTHRTKKCLRPTHPLRIISGTALRPLDVVADVDPPGRCHRCRAWCGERLGLPPFTQINVTQPPLPMVVSPLFSLMDKERSLPAAGIFSCCA